MFKNDSVMRMMTSDDDRDGSVLHQLGIGLQLLLLPHIHELSLQHVLSPPPSVLISSLQLRVLRELTLEADEMGLRCPHLVIVVSVLGLGSHQDRSQQTKLCQSQIVEIRHFHAK